MRKGRFVATKKWVIFIFCIFFFTIIQTAVRSMSIIECRPIFLLSLSVSCSMFLDQKDAAIFGFICGLFWDSFSGRLYGYSSLILIVICVFVSLVCGYIVHVSVWNNIILTLIGMVIYNIIDFIFRYMVWNFSSIWTIWIYHVIPTIIYTVLISPVMYILCKFIFNRLINNRKTNYVK